MRHMQKRTLLIQTYSTIQHELSRDNRENLSIFEKKNVLGFT